MAVTLMAVTEKMRNIIYKYGLLFSIGMFLFFSFSSIALAVNYGEGIYNSGLYPAEVGGGSGSYACLSGTTGTYPNCVSNNVCPSGTTGTYPNCIASSIVSSCQPGALFSPTTGQPCTTYTSSAAYTLCQPGTLFSPTTGKPCTAYTSSSDVGSTFTRTLKLISPRMTGNDVKDLQTYLNTHGYDVGTADGIFGNKTKSAVIAFQTANNLTPDGAVGPKTVNYMNTGQSQNPIVTPPVTTFTRTLKLISPRMTGNDVKDLQTYLNTHGYDVGTADGIFGNKTKSAVIAFQTANNLTPDGAVGPKTRELMK